MRENPSSKVLARGRFPGSGSAPFILNELTFPSKNNEGANRNKKLAVLATGTQTRKLLPGCCRQPRLDLRQCRLCRVPDFTPPPNGQSSGHFGLPGFERLNCETIGLEEFPPAPGCVAPDMGRIMQHLDFVVQIIKDRDFIALKINHGHATARPGQTRHFPNRFADIGIMMRCQS